MGTTDVGSMVDVGWATDHDLYSAIGVSRLSDASDDGRLSVERGHLLRSARHSRFSRYSDHPHVGRGVEDVAPACIDSASRAVSGGPGHAGGAVREPGGLRVTVHLPPDQAPADRRGERRAAQTANGIAGVNPWSYILAGYLL